jgi:hypothetical protein
VRALLLCALVCGCDARREGAPDDGGRAPVDAAVAGRGDAAVAASDLAVPDDAAVTRPDFATDDAAAPGPCTPLPPFDWQAYAYVTDSGDVLVSLTEPAQGGGYDAQATLYLGPQSQLAHLPITRTVSCTDDKPVCDGTSMLLGGNDFYLLSGTISLDQITSPLSSEIKATLSNLVFHEAQPLPADGGSYVETFQGSACATLALQVVDTTVAVGMPCGDVRDCGTFGKACVVSSGRCALSECSTDGDCGAGRACVAQHTPSSATDGLAASACYTRCTPSTKSACGSGECVRRPGVSPTVGEWICMPSGSGTVGGACSPLPGTNSTGCLPGLVSTSSSVGALICARHCDPYAAAPGCSSTERCIWDSCHLPLSPTQVSSAAIGQPCTTMGQPCADDGKTYRGTCDFDMKCHAICELGSSCSTGACTVGIAGPVCP